MKFGLAGNYRTLLLLLLLLDRDDTVFIIQDRPDSEIATRMEKLGYRCFCYKRSGINGIRDLISYYRQQKDLKRFLKSLHPDSCRDEVCGADHIYALFKHFRKYNHITVVEEGTSNYMDIKQLLRSHGFSTFGFFMKRVLLCQTGLIGYIPYGYSDHVENVLLTGAQEIPKELKEKTQIIRPENLWNRERAGLVNAVFDFNPDFFQGKTVLLTQPLSEEGILTEEEKISMYREILEAYPGDTVIKPHPRERTDYRRFFQGKAAVYDRPFPFELVKLNQVKPERVITVYSSAAYDFDGICDVVFLGTAGNRKIEAFFEKGEQVPHMGRERYVCS